MGILNKIFERLGWSIPEELVKESVAADSRREQAIYTLRDRSGRSYTMAVDKEDPFGNRWWVLPADGKRRRGQVIASGYVDAVRGSDDKPATLTLGDIHIADMRDRHKSLGTAMLQTLFEVARREGIRYMHGFVTPDDQQATPGLVAWYRREGFLVQEDGRSILIAIDLQTLDHKATE
jgi:ribosomal protein S18 acetylase RimI-like enzyme